MFMSFIKTEFESFDTSFTFVGEVIHPHVPCPRAAHAHMLAIAAARRLRALDRRRNERLEDAEYWIACAPVAVAKACALRDDFAPLP